MNQTLVIACYYENRRIKTFRLDSDQALSIGSDRNAQIRVSDYDGQISCQDNEWCLIENSRSQKLPSELNLGLFRLEFEVLKPKRTLFVKTVAPQNSSAKLIVLKKGEETVDTRIVYQQSRQAAGDHFSELQQMLNQNSEIWDRSELSIIESDVEIEAIEPTGESIFSAPENKFLLRMGSSVAVFYFLALVLVYFMPKSEVLMKPEDKALELKNNRFTKMIYDSKEFEQAQERSRDFLKDNFDTEIKESVAAEKTVSEPVQEVIKNIKESGISDLIGQLAKNSVLSADSVQVKAAIGDLGLGGHNLAKASSKLSGAVAKAATYKLGKVGTTGIAKQKGLLQASGTLQKGRIGSGEVAVLENETVIDGGLDPEIIAGVIRRHLGEVRYCYERQLSRQNELEGKVQLNFAINADGSVAWQKVDKTTLNNAMVEGCILRRVAKWKFPEPKGGTSVRVTYPFLLKSTN